jgi:NodT family efflux transporter outer membrane factor (OMF) lipoprotein
MVTIVIRLPASLHDRLASWASAVRPRPAFDVFDVGLPLSDSLTGVHSMLVTSVRRAVPVFGLAAFVVGCAVGPDFMRPSAPETKDYEAGGMPQPDVPEPTETQQRFAVGKKISNDWWQLFHSSRLESVLEEAIAGSQTLAAAKATLAQAQQGVLQAAGALYPQVDLAAGAQRQRVNFAAIGEPVEGPIINLFNIGPTVSYSVDVFGRYRRQVEEQQALAEYQAWELDAAYLTLTGNAATQAFQIASVRAQIAAVQTIIADDERNLGLVQTELRAGEATQIDVQSAQSQLAADRTLLPPLRQQLSVARHALSVLSGRAPGDWMPPDFDLAEFTLPEDLPVSLPSELVRQRPDILAAEAQLHAASAAVGVATAQLYPSIDLTASFEQFATKPSKLFVPASSVFDLAGNLVAPIFHGGTLRAQKKAAVDAFDGAYATYRQTVLTSFGQVADSLQALSHDAELLEAEHRALDSAEANLRLTRTTYSYGNVGILQVLDAQRLAEQARLGYVRAQAQRYLDTVELLTAMGGGWWQSQDQTALAVTPGKAPR